MSNAVKCPGCGKQYAWSPELAGKRVRCGCGQTIQVAVAAPSEDDLFDLAPETPVGTAAPKAVVAQVRQAATSEAGSSGDAGGGLQDAIRTRLGVIPGKTSETRERERLEAHRRELEERTKPDLVRDTLIPIGLIVGGFALMLYEGQLTGGSHTVAAGALIAGAVLRAVMAVAMMAIGLFLARALMDVTFPHGLKDSALRFIAIAIGPSALYGVMTAWFGELGGPAMGVLATIVAYTILFKLLMLLDTRDTAVCVLTTFIVVAMARYAAFRIGAYEVGSPI